MHVALLSQNEALITFMEEIFQGLKAYSLSHDIHEKTQVIIHDNTLTEGSSKVSSTLPIIVLSHFISGGGLVLHYPFKIRELITVLQALESESYRPWSIGLVLFSPLHKSISVREKVAYLTQIECGLLNTLCVHPEGQSIQALQVDVLGYAPDAQTHAVETHLYRLRKKLALLGIEDLILFEERGYFLSQPAHLE